MNIICNSCVGSRLYELFNIEYGNPFMWNVIPYSDFKRLILNYSSIDFTKVEISLYSNPKLPIAQAVFDSAVRVYYIHYHYNAKYPAPKKNNIDVLCSDILSYARDKVEKRTARMLNANEEPIFILETRDRARFDTFYTDNDIEDFINLDTPYKKMVITSHEKYRNYPSIKGNTNIFYFNDKHPELPPDTELMAKQLYNAFKHNFPEKRNKTEKKSLPNNDCHIIYY